MPSYFASTPAASTLVLTGIPQGVGASGYVGAPAQLVQHIAGPETHWHEEHHGVEVLIVDPSILLTLAVVGVSALCRRTRQLPVVERFCLHVRPR
jgi:hypothetical protein